MDTQRMSVLIAFMGDLVQWTGSNVVLYFVGIDKVKNTIFCAPLYSQLKEVCAISISLMHILEHIIAYRLILYSF